MRAQRSVATRQGSHTKEPIRRGGRPGPHGYLFEITGGTLCLDLANTVDCRPTEDRRELLGTYKDLVDWGKQAGAVSKAVAANLERLARLRPLAARAALRRARLVREAAFDMFSALAAGRPAPPSALRQLNVSLGRSLARLRLDQRGNDFAWSWDTSQDPLDQILWPVVRSAGELANSELRQRIRECAADRCAWLFLDRSKNGTRRWCDMTVCGNRAKARRYYARLVASRRRKRRAR